MPTTNDGTPGQGAARRRVRGAMLATLLGATALTGFAAGHVSFADDSTQPPAQSAAPSADATKITPQAMARTLPDFSGLVDQVSPAVVSVTVKMTVKPEDADAQMQGQMQQG